MKEMLVFAFVALLTEAVVPGVAQMLSERREAAAAAEEAALQDDGSAEEIERLEAENKILRDLLVEKEIALREASEEVAEEEG